MSEVGKVTRVQIAEGDSSVRVDVRLSPSREYEDLLFRTPSTGVWFVPETGDVVEVTTVGDTRKIAHSPMQSPGFQIPDDAEQGDIIFKPSSDVTFRMDKSGGIDLVTGSGYLNINSDGSIEMSETPTGGGGFSGSHNDLSDVSSDDHHTKTTSQTDLADFSSDSENIYIQDTEPSSPSENDIWIDTS